MEISTQMKKELISKYILGINFNNFKNSELTVSDIELGLREILKENARIEIKYKNDVLVTEEKGVKKRTIDDNVKSITVAFIDGEYTDSNGNIIPRVHKFDYIIG